MKILAHKSISTEALGKNMRMLWKTNKGIQISEVDEDLYLVEFGDGRDKKKFWICAHEVMKNSWFFSKSSTENLL